MERYVIAGQLTVLVSTGQRHLWEVLYIMIMMINITVDCVKPSHVQDVMMWVLIINFNESKNSSTSPGHISNDHSLSLKGSEWILQKFALFIQGLPVWLHRQILQWQPLLLKGYRVTISQRIEGTIWSWCHNKIRFYGVIVHIKLRVASPRYPE